MGTKRANIDLGYQSLGLHGESLVDHSVLSLKAGSIASRFDRILAVIDAPEASLRDIHQRLKDAFSRMGAAEGIAEGQEEIYLASLLRQMSLEGSAERSVAVAIAIWIQDQVVLGIVGGARALIVRSHGGHSGGADGKDEQVSVQRYSLCPRDMLVLEGAELARHVDEAEVRHTLQSSVFVEDAARWLATLGSGRGGRQSTVLVVKVDPKKTPKKMAKGAPTAKPVVVHPQHKKRRIVPPLRTAGLGAIAIALVLAAIAVAPSVLKSSGSAIQLQAPNGLRPSHGAAGNVYLTWNPSPGASGYAISIAGRVYRVRKTPDLILKNVLAQSRSYGWKVRSLYGNEESTWSPIATLTVGPAPPLAQPVVISPKGTYPAWHASAMYFCWTSGPSVTRFDLLLSGDHRHYNRSRQASVSKHSVSIRSCEVVKLPPAGRFSWRLGAATPGHVEAWTQWRHFFIAAPPAITPTPLQTPVIVSTPTSTFNTGTGTGYGTQPSTSGTSQQPATGPSGSINVPAPAPTSPVQSCSNPPNCT